MFLISYTFSSRGKNNRLHAISRYPTGRIILILVLRREKCPIRREIFTFPSFSYLIGHVHSIADKKWTELNGRKRTWKFLLPRWHYIYRYKATSWMFSMFRKIKIRTNQSSKRSEFKNKKILNTLVGLVLNWGGTRNLSNVFIGNIGVLPLWSGSFPL